MEHKFTNDEIERIKSGRAILLDVRSEREVAEGTSPYAKHWDIDQMIQGRFPDLDKKLPVFTFCRTNNRSTIAQQLMSAQGFMDVHAVGGFDKLPDELL